MRSDIEGTILTESIMPSELSYADALRELESIVAELDRSDVDVDALNERFARALSLLEELDRRVGRVRSQVNDLLPRLDALGAPSEDLPSGKGPADA